MLIIRGFSLSLSEKLEERERRGGEYMFVNRLIFVGKKRGGRRDEFGLPELIKPI